MRISIIVLLTVLVFSANVYSQKAPIVLDSIGLFNPLYNYEWNNSISLDSTYKLDPTGQSSLIVPGGTIEWNGFRTPDGVLYTMRIVVPNYNSAALREYNWTPSLDSLDQQIIFPPAKKK